MAIRIRDQMMTNIQWDGLDLETVRTSIQVIPFLQFIADKH